MAELISKEPFVPPTQEELNSVIAPNAPGIPPKTFTFGKDSAGKPRVWKVEPLRWPYEKTFRKYAMPMMGVAFRPFEVMIANMSQSMVTPDMKSVVETMVESEVAMDDYLVAATHIILLMQDNEVTLDWVEKNAESREQLMAIVEQQCDLLKIMDRLGESLAERLRRVASMMGIQIDSATLKQLWKQLTANFSAQITNFTSTVDSVSGQSMASLPETLAKNFTRKPESTAKRNVEDVLDPLLKENGEESGEMVDSKVTTIGEKTRRGTPDQ